MRDQTHAVRPRLGRQQLPSVGVHEKLKLERGPCLQQSRNQLSNVRLDSAHPRLEEYGIEPHSMDAVHGPRSVGRCSPYACRIGIAQGLVDTARLARLVREPLRFTLRQALRRRRLGRYRLRVSRIPVYLRHNTPDMNTLDEIFRHGHYDLPRPVEEVLEATPGTVRIVDLGANVGLFGAFALGVFPDARIVGFEPEPSNADMHRRTIGAREADGRWVLVEAAAAGADGTVSFSADGFTTGHVGEGELTVPAVDVFPYLDAVDLLKIDVEGAEWNLLADPRFAEVPAGAVALEYHPRGCPSEDPRSFAHKLLRDCGYETADHDSPSFAGLEGQGMVWAWKKP